MARYLIEKGAELNAVDNEGNTPLTTYMRWLSLDSAHRQSEFIRLMDEKGADINHRNNTGQSAVWNWICANFFLQKLSVQWLLDLGSTIRDERNANGENILEYVARRYCAPAGMIKTLAEKLHMTPTTTGGK